MEKKNNASEENKTFTGVSAVNRSPSSPVEHLLQVRTREGHSQPAYSLTTTSSNRPKKQLGNSITSASDRTLVAGNTNVNGNRDFLPSPPSHRNSVTLQMSGENLKGISINLFSEKAPEMNEMLKDTDQSFPFSMTEGFDYSYDKKSDTTASYDDLQTEELPESAVFKDEQGHYLLRQDVFLSHHQQKNTSRPSHDMSHNRTFFENIDSMFDEFLSENDVNLLYSDTEKEHTATDSNPNTISTDNTSPDLLQDTEVPNVDVQELRDISKMCFAAMCVVFSSHNPSTTVVKSDVGEEASTQDTDSNGSPVDNNLQSSLSSAYLLSLDKDVYKTQIFMRHERRLLARKDNEPNIQELDVDQVSDEKSANAPARKNHHHIASTAIVGTENEIDSLVGTTALTQRPPIPIAVLYMLWCNMIGAKFRDKYLEEDKDWALSDKMLNRIFGCVRNTLVRKMNLLKVCYDKSKEGSDHDNCEDKETMDATECLQINHDLHQQYGLYLAQNSSLFSFFVKGLPDDQGTPRHKMPYRIYEKDTWNPEHALNFVLASCCLSCLNRAKKMEKRNYTQQLQYEYSIEMLPWHLMRSLCFDTVADLLTDVSFVKSRLSSLDFFDAASMHIGDFEELYEGVTNIMTANPSLVVDIDIDQAMTESYGLLGSLIRSKDVSRWHYEDKKDDESGESSQIEEHIDLKHVRGVARSLEALGDSLFSYNKQKESSKYYYRALVRYEHINNVEMSRFTQSGDNSILQNEETQLSMGGVLSRIASVYQCDSEFANAMLCYEKALSFFSKCQSKNHVQGVSKTLASMGELHFDLKEFASALSCFNEALRLLRSMDGNNDETIANLLLLMGNVRREKGDLDEALELFSESLYCKVLIYGNSHPEVGFIHQIIGVAFCDKQDFEQAIIHFEHSLKIRKAAVSLVQSCLPSNDKTGRIQSRELEVSESLEFLGKVYETLNDLDLAFMFYEESSNIHHNHLMDLCVNDSSILTVSDIFEALNSEGECDSFVEDIYCHLQSAIKIGFRLCPIGRIFKSTLSIEDMIEIEGHMAEILYDMGLIRGAQFLQKEVALESIGNQNDARDFSSERKDFTSHLEDSLALRKSRIDKLLREGKDGDEEVVKYEKITIAIILYELGKLYSWFVIRNDIEVKKPRTLRLISSRRDIVVRDCRKAIAYFEEAKGILRDSIEMAETLGYSEEEQDVFISRLHLTPTLYEEMLQAMAVLYRKLDEYDKSIECYNEFSILSTRVELEDKMDSESMKNFPADKKQKVAVASQSIGDILFDTGEFARALESYEEALKLLRASGAENLVIADTLNRKGSILLKLEQWDESVLTFNEALGIRVDTFPQDQNEIAKTFHSMGKAYEGHKKFEQALDYYKKAQRIVSGRLVDTDTNAADLFFDLGNIVLFQDEAASRFIGKKPSEDDISLALTCLALSRDIYTRRFGVDALEVGNALSLLGVIFQKYGEVAVAISSFKRALRIFKAAPLDQSEKIRKTLIRLGTSLLEVSTEDNEELIESLSLARELYEDQDSCKSVDYADLIFLFGQARSKCGEADAAFVFYEDALTLYRSALGKNHAIASKPLTKLGAYFIQKRKHDEAKNLLQEAIQLYCDHDLLDDLICAEIHFNLGIVYCETGELERAMDSYEVCLQIRRRELGCEDINVAQVLNNIGSVFARNKEYQRALTPWQDAIDIYKSLGVKDDDSKVSCTRGNMEISKNLVSPSPAVSILRNICGY